ncbi:MAG: hypothetical protein AAGA46_03485 [Cyanobacteria bacterium P01_F01_bin.13]
MTPAQQRIAYQLAQQEGMGSVRVQQILVGAVQDFQFMQRVKDKEYATEQRANAAVKYSTGGRSRKHG